jgi:sulfoxide reductase heme-binding subunit YedZ
MIGPWNKLRGRPNPVSGYLRRDIGIWAGVLGIAHVVVGLQVHLGGKFWLYFLPPADARSAFPLRVDAFGLTNYAGLGAALILLLLLSLSNNASLRALGAGRWKSLQRWNYAGALLVVAHGTVYQVIEERTAGFIAAFAAVVILAVAMQVAGVRNRKKE